MKSAQLKKLGFTGNEIEGKRNSAPVIRKNFCFLVKIQITSDPDLTSHFSALRLNQQIVVILQLFAFLFQFGQLFC